MIKTWTMHRAAAIDPTAPIHFSHFKQVVFKVSMGATSPLVFGASVWKDGTKLADAAPVEVTVIRK